VRLSEKENKESGLFSKKPLSSYAFKNYSLAMATNTKPIRIINGPKQPLIKAINSPFHIKHKYAPAIINAMPSKIFTAALKPPDALEASLFSSAIFIHPLYFLKLSVNSSISPTPRSVLCRILPKRKRRQEKFHCSNDQNIYFYFVSVIGALVIVIYLRFGICYL